MEYWEQVVLGVVVSSGVIIVLFIFLDKYVFALWRNNGRDYDNITRSQAISQWPVKVKNAIVKGSANRNLDGYTKLSDADEDEEISMSARIAQDLYDEYESFQHECLVFIGASPKDSLHSVVGICIYLLDRNVEYFCEAVPVDYLNYFKSPNEEQQAVKACVMAGVEMWAPKWFSANAVHILCNDYDTVCEINKEGTMLNQQLESLVRDGNFKPFIDWTDNYFCETNANEELWEGIITCGKKLLEHRSVSFDEEAIIPWDELGPTESWNRTKVMLNYDLLVSSAKRLSGKGQSYTDSEQSDDDEQSQEKIEEPLIDI